MRILGKVLLSSFLVLMFALSLKAQIIFLKDGRLLHVKVLSGDERGVAVERLDNGGQLFLRWDHLRAEDSKRLRIEFGLEDDDSGADLVMPGHRIHARKGDYLDGLIIEETQDKVVLQRENCRIEYLRSAIRRIEERPVSLFDVYTPEELYQQRLGEIQPVDDDVIGHFEMARWATKVEVYHEAIGHFLKVKAADPDYKSEYIENQLKRLEVLDRNKEIRLAIRTAERAGYQHRYAECLAYFDEILAASGLDPTLKKEVEKKRDRFVKRRWKYYSEEVVKTYHREVRKKLKELAQSKDIKSSDQDKTLTIQKAMSYCRQQLHKDLVESIAKKFELEPKKEVEEMWKNRKFNIKLSATYGSGTFIVESAGGASRGGMQEGQLNRQVQEARARLERMRQGGGQEQQGNAQPELITKDEWWVKSDSVQREFFLRAYFAEQCGQMQVISSSWRICQTCGGSGSIKQLGSQGGYVKVTCPRSHGLKGDKIIYYR